MTGIKIKLISKIIFLKNRQVTNHSSVKIELSKPQIPKIIQSARFFDNI